MIPGRELPVEIMVGPTGAKPMPATDHNPASQRTADTGERGESSHAPPTPSPMLMPDAIAPATEMAWMSNRLAKVEMESLPTIMPTMKVAKGRARKATSAPADRRQHGRPFEHSDLGYDSAE